VVAVEEGGLAVGNGGELSRSNQPEDHPSLLSLHS
jgi:hypothetical protein